jgi:hypothetical protein
VGLGITYTIHAYGVRVIFIPVGFVEFGHEVPKVRNKINYSSKGERE